MSDERDTTTGEETGVEGHAMRIRVKPEHQQSDDQPEVEGHGMRVRFANEGEQPPAQETRQVKDDEQAPGQDEDPNERDAIRVRY